MVVPTKTQLEHHCLDGAAAATARPSGPNPAARTKILTGQLSTEPSAVPTSAMHQDGGPNRV